MMNIIEDYQLKAAHNSTKKYGITESKKAELDHLTDEVIDAQHLVLENQAIVTSLSQKLTKFQGFLATAEENKLVALSNWNTTKEVLNQILNLKDNSDTGLLQMYTADKKMQEVAVQTKKVLEELIYTVEVINKLSNLIVKKKAKNPLISDELIDLLGTTGTDANNAVALMLTALKTAFSSQASSMESEAAASLEYMQSVNLYQVFTGTNQAGDSVDSTIQPMEALLKKAYADAKINYATAQLAVKITMKQLNAAKANLSKAEVSLSSFQSGLAAANAAALAS